MSQRTTTLKYRLQELNEEAKTKGNMLSHVDNEESMFLLIQS